MCIAPPPSGAPPLTRPCVSSVYPVCIQCVSVCIQFGAGYTVYPFYFCVSVVYP